jgi:hypothetical protein
MTTNKDKVNYYTIPFIIGISTCWLSFSILHVKAIRQIKNDSVNEKTITNPYLLLYTNPDLLSNPTLLTNPYLMLYYFVWRE